MMHEILKKAQTKDKNDAFVQEPLCLFSFMYPFAAKLERFETPQKIELVSEDWTVESGLVTDSFKLKRKNIQAFYAKQLKALYA